MEDWRRFHDAVLDDLAPRGATEARLASRAAQILWRLARAAAQEAALIDTAAESGRRYERRMDWLALNERRLSDDGLPPAAGQSSSPPRPPVRGLYAPLIVADAKFPEPEPLRILSTRPSLELVMRYETHLNRQLIQTLALLEALQRRHRSSGREQTEICE
jgi:hypothetical protein